MYWTGDLAYRDEAGFIYFAGRDIDWLRVDGENFASAPIERILERFSGVTVAAVYAVPDVTVGDQVMAALQLEIETSFDGRAFADFLAMQSDLGTKWAPRYIRLSKSLPVTQTSKVQKRLLRPARWECGEPVLWSPTRGEAYRRITQTDIAEIQRAFEARGRSNLL